MAAPSGSGRVPSEPITFADRDAYAARMTDAVLWRPYVEAVCAREGLPFGPMQAGDPGTNVVFLVGGRFVVKLFPRLFEGDAQHAWETAVYGLLDAHPGLPVPRLLGSGELFPGHEWCWPYLVTTIVPGTPISTDRDALTPDDWRTVAAFTGEVLRGFHAIPVPPGSLGPDRADFSAFLAAQRPGCVERHRAWGTLPGHLVEQIGPFVDAVLAERVPPPSILLNGDLTAEHVLGERAGGRWAPTGIFDFGDARLGDPVWDLLAVHLDFFRGDRDLLRACLAAASWTPGPAFAREAMAFVLLHEWDVLAEVHVPLGHYATLDELAAALWGV